MDNTSIKKELSQENLAEYFKNLVETALQNQEFTISKLTEFYIVNLLSEYFRIDKLYENGRDDVPLAILLTEALSSQISKKILLFKKIGDYSLYISGYFSDSLNRKIVDISYYISMGENAYTQLYDLARYSKREKMLAEAYSEISMNFIKMVDLISEISDSQKSVSNADLLKVYEKWLLTKSERLAKQLKEAGITPTSEITSKYPH
jgi:hypothetical protein